MDSENFFKLLIRILITSVIGLSLCVYYYIDENNKKKEEQDQNKINGLIAGISLFSVILLTLIIILIYTYFTRNNKPQKDNTFHTPKNQSIKPLLTPTDEKDVYGSAGSVEVEPLEKRKQKYGDNQDYKLPIIIPFPNLTNLTNKNNLNKQAS